jgi:protein-disulfide isomerase
MKNSVFAIVIGVSVGLLVLLAASVDQPDLPPVALDGSINAGQVSKEVSAGQARLLDVRTQVEYDLGHAVGADLFNVERIKAGELPPIEKDERIYLYCRSGNRSAQAKAILDASGYTNIIDLGGIQSWTDGGGATEQTQTEDYLTLLEQIDRSPIEPLGPADADLVIVKYSDFSCPFCARYTLETEPQIRQTYINDPGSSVRYEFRNYSYLGDESAIAAVGGYCANEQSLFWPYHDAITQGYAQQGPDYLTNDQFTQTITQIGGDATAFSSCINSGLYEQVVSAEAIAAQAAGITSTPTVLVGDQEINGALPYDIFKAAIDARL